MTRVEFSRELISWEGPLSRGDFYRLYVPLAATQFLMRVPFALTASRLLAWGLASIGVFVALSTLFQILKRLEDTGHSRWLALLLVVPFVNLYPIYCILIQHGHASK